MRRIPNNSVEDIGAGAPNPHAGGSTSPYATIPRLHPGIATGSGFRQVAAHVREMKIPALGQYVLQTRNNCEMFPHDSGRKLQVWITAGIISLAKTQRTPGQPYLSLLFLCALGVLGERSTRFWPTAGLGTIGRISKTGVTPMNRRMDWRDSFSPGIQKSQSPQG
jgi:hypothetical protein